MAVKKTTEVKTLPRPVIPTNYSNEQRAIMSIVGGDNNNSIWGSGSGLPVRHRTLESGGGIIKSGDNGQTGNMFGVRRIRI